MTRAPDSVRVTGVALLNFQTADLRERIQKKAPAATTTTTTINAMILLVVIAVVIRYMRRIPPNNGLQVRTGCPARWPG